MSKKVTPEQFILELEKKDKLVREGIEKAIDRTCNAVKNTAVQGMTNTQVDNSKVYGKKGHHPSLPDNYPSVDTGTLRRSITYEVKTEGKKTIGRVGSPIEYGKFLETGTSRMTRPRKWLKPSLDKNTEKLKEELGKIIK